MVSNERHMQAISEQRQKISRLKGCRIRAGRELARRSQSLPSAKAKDFIGVDSETLTSIMIGCDSRIQSAYMIIGEHAEELISNGFWYCETHYEKQG